MIWCMIDRILKVFGISRIIKTPVGLKPINQLDNSDHYPSKVIEVKNDVKPSDIICCPDFLKDKYTSLGKIVKEWPHYKLIETFDKGADIGKCDYIKRAVSGTLDFRKKMTPDVRVMKEHYQRILKEINEKKTLEVYVVNAGNGRYMAVDRKHTLAQAVYFSYGNIIFKVIENIMAGPYYMRVFDRIKDDKEYSAHIDFYGSLSEHGKR